MATWYAPLVLPVPLVNLPQDYQSKIPLYDASNATTASQHVDKMNDYFDRNEIDDDSIKLRLFSQSLGGEVRKWFKGLTPHSIRDLQAFHQKFLNKWEVKKTLSKSFLTIRISIETLGKVCKLIALDSIVCIMHFPRN